MDVRHDAGQAAPLLDGEVRRDLDEALDHVEVVVLGVADSDVTAVQVHLPRHLLRAGQLHLVGEEVYVI